MSGEHTDEHDYKTFLVEIEQKFAILEKMDPSNKKYNLIWGPLLSQFMQLLNAAKKSSSHIFLQDNRNKIIDMCNKLFATITNQQLQLSNENKELAKKLRDAFLEAAENIAKTNDAILAILGVLGVTLFENALKTAVQIQDPTWHSDPTRAKTIRDLHHKLSPNYSKQQQTEINNIMDTYLPTRTRQNMRFAQQFAKAEDEYTPEESSRRESRNSPPQQSELEKQTFIMLTLTKLMRQSNDYSMRNTLNRSNLAVPPPLSMISDFENILQTCLKLQNYQKFILEQIEFIIQIHDFLGSHFNRILNAATSMKTIHDLMRKIISVAAAEEAESHSVPRKRGNGTTEREERSSKGNPPKTTSYNDITERIDKIFDAIISYNAVHFQLTDSVKKTKMLSILDYFNNTLTMYIENGNITQQDYKKINVIRDAMADINQINKLKLVLKKTEGLMLQIDSIFEPSSSSKKRWWTR